MKSCRPIINIHIMLRLMEKGYFSESEVISNLGVSRSSFFRSISDIRCYLQEYQPEKELVFDPDEGIYRLKKWE